MPPMRPQRQLSRRSLSWRRSRRASILRYRPWSSACRKDERSSASLRLGSLMFPRPLVSTPASAFIHCTPELHLQLFNTLCFRIAFATRAPHRLALISLFSGLACQYPSIPIPAHPCPYYLLFLPTHAITAPLVQSHNVPPLLCIRTPNNRLLPLISRLSSSTYACPLLPHPVSASPSPCASSITHPVYSRPPDPAPIFASSSPSSVIHSYFVAPTVSPP